jgi:MFS family permease
MQCSGGKINTDVAPGARGTPKARSAVQRRDLAGACLAHTIHDGYTDLLYALLTVWQAEFRLTYAGLAAIRVLYFGTMGALQVPGDRWLRTISARAALALATAVAALGYLVMTLPGGLFVLGAGLILAGIGSSIQHPRASLLVTKAYGKRARGPLGIYNFAGDLGKAILPALVALLLPFLAWRSVLALVALLGFLVAGMLLLLIPHQPTDPVLRDETLGERAESGKGFGLLLTIGALDTAPRMGYLLFLPFLIQGKGGTEATVGIGLALLFTGGALGKAVCGWLGQHIGVVSSVVATEAATALLMITTLFLPLGATLAALPLLGIVLNGTSSVLYGTVSDVAPKGDTGRAFALFYTGVIVMGALAPIAYGLIADHTSTATGTAAAAATAALIIPLVLALRPALADPRIS